MNLHYAAISIVVLSGLFAQYKYPAMQQAGKQLSLWLIFSAAWEAISFITALVGHTNTIYFYLYSVTETLFVAWALTSFSGMKNYRRSSILVAALLGIMAFIEWFTRPAQEIGTWSRLAQVLFILFLVGFSLIRFMQSSWRSYYAYRAEYWFCVSCLIFFSIHLFLIIGNNFLLNTNFAIKIHMWNDVAAIGSATVAAIGLVLCKRLPQDLIYNKA